MEGAVCRPLGLGPTDPILCAVKATILGHILAPFGVDWVGFGGFKTVFLWFWGVLKLVKN